MKQVLRGHDDLRPVARNFKSGVQKGKHPSAQMLICDRVTVIKTEHCVAFVVPVVEVLCLHFANVLYHEAFLEALAQGLPRGIIVGHRTKHVNLWDIL